MSDRQKQMMASDRGKHGASTMFVRQRTLKSPVHCSGIGLHSGHPVSISLFPAPADHGIVFRRTDIGDRDNQVIARWDKVVATHHCTVLGNDDGVTVATVEHLMAALVGCRIDNVLIAIDGGEVPIMDGSAAPFVFLIECASAVEQDAPRRYLRLRKTVEITERSKNARLIPSDGVSLSCEIEFDNPLIARQDFTLDLAEGMFKAEISRARTFGFVQDLDMLRSAGLARGGSLDNAIVVEGDRVLNQDGLRYDDEFVRHKVLDCVGDLALAGGPILARFEGVRCGHALNNKLLHALFADPANWEWVTQPAHATADMMDEALVA